jgi:N-acetylated-alpha-linked acidic dipeptidase
MSRLLLLASCCIFVSASVLADNLPTSSGGPALEKSFDAQVNPAEMGSWMKLMASEPNHVSSPHDKFNAEWEMEQLKKFGWDAHIETFQVLYPVPMSETLEMVAPKPFKATLQEPPIKGDTSATAKEYALPAYVAFQGDGDVTAPLVYVNYGMQDDYKRLELMGISVKGKIVIARYGSGWRGLKPKLAQDHGAVGCLIYSDPADDGYSEDAVYPNGPARPPHGFQRGSVADMPIYPGDPLTPGVGATADAKRLTREEAQTILKIPVLPISYADAQVFLSAMGGDVAPAGWRGALPITYHVDSGKTLVHLAVKSDWSLKPLYDVVATLKGSEYPDQWVVRGNHHDGWVFGASDPLSGQIALLEEAKILGDLEKTGWRPKRTIVYTSWDGEEPMLLGSTEWAETHAAELKQKAVIYINTDGNGRGMFGAEGSEDFTKLVNEIAAGVTDPEKHVSIGERRRAALQFAALDPSSKGQAKQDAKLAGDPAKDFPIQALGSGSDYSAFIEHLGVPAFNFGFGGEGDAGGVYHSRYDTYEHHSRFVDPGFVYDALLAKTIGHLVIRMADADVPLQQTGDFAESIAFYLSDVKKLADDKRDQQEAQAKMISSHVFALVSDPAKTSGEPTALKPVPKFDFTLIDDAAKRLSKSANAYDDAFTKHAASLTPEQRTHLMALMQTIDQTLAPDVGLPGRPWYKNLIYAPGRYTGYGAKTLPGIREAIEEERWDDATRYIKLTADALNAYSDRLDQARAVLGG